MGIDDWSTDESQNLELDGSDISRRASPGAPANELTRKLMANIKAIEDKIVTDAVSVDGITIVSNDGTLTVKDVAIDGDTTDLLTEKITEIEAAATQAGEDATAAQTAATQAAASASSATSAITSAATAANAAAEQADIAARAAARAQSGAAMAESAVEAVISGTNFNWQRSEKAGAVAIYPVPETVLEPTVDFMFTETGPASGDKGPENPSTITGVTAINIGRCGKNLVKNNATQGSGIFTIDNETGVLTANGTIATYVSFQYRFPFNKPLPAGRYLLSFNNPKADSNLRCSLRAANANLGSGSDIGRDGYLDSVNKVRVVEIQSGSTNAMLLLSFSPDTYEDFSVAMQLEPMTSGETPTAYEPPVRQDCTLSLGSTYYGGSLDVATGVMTVTWAGYRLNSSLNIATDGTTTSYYRYKITGFLGGDGLTGSSTHFNYNNSYFNDSLHFYVSASGSLFVFTTQSTASKFGDWLDEQTASGTPVIVCYKLAKSYTVQLAPTEILSLAQPDKYTPRLNTVYTDASAVQIGYAKSPIRSEYELTQAIIATEGGE